MNETPNTRMAELFNAMVGAYETWAQPLSARLAQVTLRRTMVGAGDCVLDIGAGTGALRRLRLRRSLSVTSAFACARCSRLLANRSTSSLADGTAECGAWSRVEVRADLNGHESHGRNPERC